MNDGLTGLNGNTGGNGTIYLNENKYNGSYNVNITLNNRNITIIDKGTTATVIIGSNIIGLSM